MENDPQKILEELQNSINTIREETIEMLQENIRYNKQIMRGLSIAWIIFLLGAIGFFVKILMYGSTTLDLITYTSLLLILGNIRSKFLEYETDLIWSEVELIQKINKEEYEKNNEKVS